MVEKEFITYQQYGKLINELEDIIAGFEHHFDYIYAPPRGGLPIAVHLSHKLNIDLLIYEEELVAEILKNKNILIVDDIADTGLTFSTFRFWENIDNKIKFATIFYKPQSTVKPDYYCRKTEKWIVFPWENIDEIPNR